jgi:hypothetical protein
MRFSALKRVGLWSASCLILIALFTALLGRFGTMDVVYRLALFFVFPLWLIFLPTAIEVRDAGGPRIWLILGLGTLAGPVVFLLLLFIQILNSGKPSIIWQGDPTLPSMALWATFAAIASLIVSAIYGFSLKALSPRVRTAL